MKFSSPIVALVSLLAVTNAIPTNDTVRRSANDTVRRWTNDTVRRSANDTSRPVYIARQEENNSHAGGGVAFSASPVAGAPRPTGTGGSVLNFMGSSPCSADGAVICEGRRLYGVCHQGAVTFRPVPKGKACVGGEIVGN
ncbi:hypothetical protein BST61_g10095 [Cercospora zeina]